MERVIEEAITAVYQLLKPILAEVITPQMYRESPFQLYVDTLLKTHKEIFSNKKHKRVFKKMTSG